MIKKNITNLLVIFLLFQQQDFKRGAKQNKIKESTNCILLIMFYLLTIKDKSV
jgi:hypothetical protein